MIRAIALYSGGLDSILACRMVMAQGVAVTAVEFVTPFFHHHLLDDRAAHCREVSAKYGIDVRLEDISPGYLDMLRQPAHGFGRHFNPCIDCKIAMLRRARAMLDELDASFLISGEVLGQRPMSQRRDTLNLIERESGCRPLLVRPLSARLLSPTLPEQEGWLDRQQLGALSGRGRSAQIALARAYGISDFPLPAGGCVLADPIQGRRIQRIYDGALAFPASSMNAADFRLLLLGRQFRLPGGGWLIVGRQEKENQALEALAGSGDALLYMEERSGPAALLRRAASCYPSAGQRQQDIAQAAALVVRYGKKVVEEPTAAVSCFFCGEKTIVTAAPVDDTISGGWML